MATYTVKAPDGKTITLEGPDGASQEDIIAQAQALYKPRTPAETKTTAPAPKKRASAPNAYLDKYNSIRGALANKWQDHPDLQQRALAQFDSDPRTQKLRKLAGLAAVSTPRQDVRKVARKSVDERMREIGAEMGKNAGGWQSAAAGIRRGLFGIPDMLGAAAERFLPSSITGNTSDASYSNILELMRAKTNAEIEANPGVAIVGELGSAIAGGGAAGKLIKSGGRRLAATGAPVVARVGNVLENLTTLRKGKKLRNAGKIAATGAAAGGAQAAGTGSDVIEGTATGAVAAPIVVGGVNVLGFASRPFRDIFSGLNLTAGKTDRFLRRLTGSTQAQLEKRAADYRKATGAEPTLFELMPLADRNKILKTAVVGKDNVVEQASNAIRRRAQNLGPEMSRRAQQILAPQRRFIARGLRRDLTAARGGQLAEGDLALIRDAMDNPTDMLRFRDEEARAIMAPHDETPVVANLEDLFPDANPITGVAADPEVSTVIRSAAGTLRQRAEGAGVTVGDITDMISTLSNDLSQGGIEGRNAQRAIDHLQNVLETQTPEAGAAARQMSEAYAARSRQAEGMQEGAAQRLRGDVQVGTNRRQAQKVRNAYDTAEGASGRSLGQGNRTLTELAGSPEEALRATVKQSRGSTSRQLTQNIGPVEADLLGAAARAQDESAQALAAASNKAQSGSGDAADAEMLVQAIAGLHPSSFITTKAGAVRRLLDMTYIPESRARTMIDMLFSQDPAMMQRALRAIGSEPNGARAVKTLAQLVGQAGADIENGGGNIDLPIDDTVSGDAPSVEDDLAGMEEPAADEAPIEAPDVGESPYGPALQQVYQNESPELIQLIQRVKMQESGGDQSAVSSAGAVGVMQVMPGTGPEAARLAGLPWDENAFRSDAAYNELLGIAYLSEMLRKYDGDVDRALAAYNAGPGAVDEALTKHDASWLENLPTETQDYVARVS